MNQEIIRYIHENRPTYTREAITAELLKQGFSERQINEAWFRVESTPPGRGGLPQIYSSQPIYWVYLLGFMLLMPVVAGLFGGFAFNPNPTGNDRYSGYSNAFTAELVVVIIAFLGGLVGYFFLRSSNRAAARGLLLGMIFSIVLPFIPVIIIGGICTFTYQFR